MIIVLGSEKVKSMLSQKYEVTNVLSKNTKCIVIDIPSQLEKIDNILNKVKSVRFSVKIICVITGTVPFSTIKQLKSQGIEVIPVSELMKTIQNIIEVKENNDDIIISDEFEENEDNKEARADKEYNKTDESKSIIFNKEAIKRKDGSITSKEDIVNKENIVDRKDREKTIFGIREEKNRELTKQLKLRKYGKIITCVSAEGGTGKTFLSLAVGGYLAINGYNTVAVDFDLNQGDLDIASGIVDDLRKNYDKKSYIPQNGWVTVLEFRQYATKFRDSILRHSSGLYIVPSYPHVGVNILSSSEAEELISLLADIFDYVVIDLGVDAFSSHSTVALEVADMIILVGGQSNKTVGKTSHLFENINKNRFNWREKMILFINKVSPVEYYSPQEVAKLLQFNNYYTIPLDSSGVNAAKRNRKLIVQIPSSEAAKSCISSFDDIFNMAEPGKKQSEKDRSKNKVKKDKKGGLFSKIKFWP